MKSIKKILPILLILLLIIVLVTLRIVNSNFEKKVLPEVAQSSIIKESKLALPISIKKSDIEYNINKHVPKTLFNQRNLDYDHKYASISNISIKVVRNGEIYLSGSSQGIQTSIPLKVSCSLDVTPEYKSYRAATQHINESFNVTLELGSTASIDSNLHLLTATRILNLDWEYTPTIEIPTESLIRVIKSVMSFGWKRGALISAAKLAFGNTIDIKAGNMIEKELRKREDEIVSNVDSQINKSVDLTEKFYDIWNKVQLPIKLDSIHYLDVNTKKLIIGKAKIVDSNLVVIAGISTIVGVKDGDVNQVSLKNTLISVENNDNLNNSLDLNVNYSVHTSLFTSLLSKYNGTQKIPTAIGDLLIDSINVSTVKNVLNVNVNFSGAAKGVLNFICLPVYTDGEVSLEVFDVAINTSNLIYNTYNFFFEQQTHSNLLKEVEAPFKINLNTFAKDANEQIQSIINSQSKESIIQVDSLTFSPNIIVRNDTVSININVKGKARLKIKKKHDYQSGNGGYDDENFNNNVQVVSIDDIDESNISYSTSTYRDLNVTINNTTGEDLYVAIDNGVFLENHNSGQQNLVNLYATSVLIPSGSREALNLSTACINPTLASPNGRGWNLMNGDLSSNLEEVKKITNWFDKYGDRLPLNDKHYGTYDKRQHFQQMVIWLSLDASRSQMVDFLSEYMYNNNRSAAEGFVNVYYDEAQEVRKLMKNGNLNGLLSSDVANQVKGRVGQGIRNYLNRR